MGWEIGELVPDVTFAGSDGQQHRLRDLAGQRAFVIAWFPKAFTGG
jgi:peroxiredoxin Q/BCP